MVHVTYYHVEKHIQYDKSFDDPYEARKFYYRTKSTGWYIMGYYCNTEYELKVMEGIYK